MKIKLNDYSLISVKWIDKQIQILSEEGAKNLGNPHPCKHTVINQKILLLQEIKKQLIPSKKLAEKCFDAGINFCDDNVRPEDKKDKQTFLNSEI